MTKVTTLKETAANSGFLTLVQFSETVIQKNRQRLVERFLYF